MKRMLAIAVVALLAWLGFAGTAAAGDEFDDALWDKCSAEFDAALDDLTADLDDVAFDQFLYDWDDIWYKWEIGQISDHELVVALDELTGGLFSEFLDCLDAGHPVKPGIDKPGPVPTSVPAGTALPATGAPALIGLVGLGLAGAGGLLLVGRRLIR